MSKCLNCGNTKVNDICNYCRPLDLVDKELKEVRTTLNYVVRDRESVIASISKDIGSLRAKIESFRAIRGQILDRHHATHSINGNPLTCDHRTCIKMIQLLASV